MRLGSRHQAYEEWGTTAVEYAIMIGLIAVVIFVAVAALGVGTNGLFSRVLPAFGG